MKTIIVQLLIRFIAILLTLGERILISFLTPSLVPKAVLVVRFQNAVYARDSHKNDFYGSQRKFDGELWSLLIVTS